MADDWMSSYSSQHQAAQHQYGSSMQQQQQQQQQQQYYGMGAPNTSQQLQHGMQYSDGSASGGGWPAATGSMGGDLQEVEL
jgi:hypothetical protein